MKKVREEKGWGGGRIKKTWGARQEEELRAPDKDEVVLQMRNYSGDASQPFREQVQAAIGSRTK